MTSDFPFWFTRGNHLFTIPCHKEPPVPDVTEGVSAGGPLPAVPVERQRCVKFGEDQILGGSSLVPGKWFITMASITTTK